jgi:hypothetical protein
MTPTTDEHQPDLLASAAPPKERARKPAAKAKDKTGTAVAVDDPAKRQQVARQQDAPPPVDPLLAAIIKASADPACDPAKMRELIAIKRELDQDAAKAAFDDAFVALQAELPSIQRDRRIEVRKKDARGERTGEIQQSTPYATFEAIMTVVKPLLTKHGFSLTFETKPMDPIFVTDGQGTQSAMERILVRGILSRKGHQRTSEFAVRPDNSGSKNPTQAQGSGQSYGKRYCTIALLNIVSHAPEDTDADGREGDFRHGKGNSLVEAEEVETLTDEELSQLNGAMTRHKVPLAVVLKHYAIESLGDLPRRLFAAALKNCESYVPKTQQGSTFPGDQISTGGPRRGSHR